MRAITLVDTRPCSSSIRGTLVRGPLHGEEQRQQPGSVSRARVLCDRAAERKMLCVRVCRQSRGVSCEKRERYFGVSTVFGEIEVYAANEIPSGTLAPEKVLKRGFRFGKLRLERRSQLVPERLQRGR